LLRGERVGLSVDCAPVAAPVEGRQDDDVRAAPRSRRAAEQKRPPAIAVEQNEGRRQEWL
jgi:hypothetical protein